MSTTRYISVLGPISNERPITERYGRANITVRKIRSYPRKVRFTLIMIELRGKYVRTTAPTDASVKCVLWYAECSSLPVPAHTHTLIIYRHIADIRVYLTVGRSVSTLGCINCCVLTRRRRDAAAGALKWFATWKDRMYIVLKIYQATVCHRTDCGHSHWPTPDQDRRWLVRYFQLNVSASVGGRSTRGVTQPGGLNQVEFIGTPRLNGSAHVIDTVGFFPRGIIWGWGEPL